MRICTYCHGEVLPPRHNWCSQECVEAYLTERYPHRIPPEIRNAVWKRASGLCEICGLPHVGSYEYHHIIPVCEGGPHTPENIQLTHPWCHKGKHARHWRRAVFCTPLSAFGVKP